MDKWLPEMKNQQGSGLSSDLEYQSILKPGICVDCKKEYNAVISFFPNGWSWKNDRSGRCHTCQKKRAEEAENQEQAAAKAEIDNRRGKWRQGCGIPLKYQFKGFEQFDQSWQPKPFRKVLEYAENFPIDKPRGYWSLILFSTRTWGTGKTHLACAAAHHILGRWNGETQRCPVRFVSEPTLFKSIRDTYSFTLQEKETQASEKDIINSLISVPLLILDDLGKEDVADLRFVQRTLFAIFDGRYNAELPVLVTANLDDTGLRAHMGGSTDNEAAFNRLSEMCKGEFIRMDGKSYRDKLAVEANK